MKIASNNVNGVFVQRQITQTIEQPTQYEMPEGLPFYYYFDIKTGLLFIGLGLIALLVSTIGSSLFYYFIFFRKKYYCPRCGYTFNDKKNKKAICPKCGTECI
jgi:ssDNA-binding Zn-finger/Zn-ribbon topoisomerase 1